MLRSLTPAVFLLLCAVLAGCTEPAAPAPGLRATESGRTGLHRLTRDEWRNAVEQLSGVRWEGELPVDYQLGGFSSVGAATLSVSQAELALYEQAAWGVAEEALADELAVEAWAGCALGVLGQPAAPPDRAACLKRIAAQLLPAAWRRPVAGDEIESWAALGQEVLDAGGTSALTAQSMLVAAVLSPDFLFRVELGGQPVAGDPLRRALTAHERAARLALAVEDRSPSAELAALAEAGELLDPAVWQAVVAEAVAGPEAAAAQERFFLEWSGLGGLALVSPDPDLFPQWNPALAAEMEAELLWLYRSHGWQGDDAAALLLSQQALLGPELAALYDVALDPLGPVTLPEERAGLLARAGFLAAHAHATSTSPTRRGRFIRTRLLCDPIPPPPDGVVASLEYAEVEGSLRQRIESLTADEPCASCHEQMDPLGFPLEGFDAIGQQRADDDGHALDLSGALEGEPVEGPSELSAALVEQGAWLGCLAEQQWSHLLGHPVQPHEEEQLRARAARFREEDPSLMALAASILESEAFLTVAAPDSAYCPAAQEGDTRPCSSACGAGVETCVAGRWSGCSAPQPSHELCNGWDDDCDGAIDEGLVRACGAVGEEGLSRCVDRAWSACAPLVRPEACNGRDDDGDGAIDEGLELLFARERLYGLAALEPDCDPVRVPDSWACRQAVDQRCGQVDCAAGGFGVAWSAVEEGLWALGCVAQEEVVTLPTSWVELSRRIGTCTGADSWAGNCNAASHRFCRDRGLVTGFGPFETDDGLVVRCTPEADVLATGYSHLVQLHPGCDGAVERVGPACHQAIQLWCRAQGAAGGHGPVENNGDAAYVSCLGTGGAP